MNGLVIKALATSMQPGLINVQYGFNDDLSRQHALYRNEPIAQTHLTTMDKLEGIKFSLRAQSGGEPMIHDYQGREFVEVQEQEAAQNLVKMAVFAEMQRLRSIKDPGSSSVPVAKTAILDEEEPNEWADYIKELSLKHQVLCEQTAIFGVLK